MNDRTFFAAALHHLAKALRSVGIIRKIHTSLVFFLHRRAIKLRVRKQRQEPYGNRRLLAIYDFIDLPFSFDVATFLVNAEVVRRKHRLEKIDVVFVAHDSNPGPPRHPYVQKENYRDFMHTMILEQTRLLDSIGGVYFFDNRDLFQEFFAAFKADYFVHPHDYDPVQPVELRPDRPAVHESINFAPAVQADPSLLALRAPRQQVELARKWILRNVFPKIPISITLREWGSWAEKRNSFIPEWQKLVDAYQELGVEFIVLRDHYTLYDAPTLKGPNVQHFNEAVCSVSLRAALYQECALNLFVANGCGALALFNARSRYIMFKFTVDDRAADLDSIKKNIGLEPPSNFHGATKYQRLVWEEDRFDAMKLHVDQMLQILRDDGVLIPTYYPSVCATSS